MAFVAGTDDARGVALVEIYDLDGAAPGRLANISSRGPVGTNDDVMIGGFIVGTQETQVLVRGLGPSLPVTNLLGDPELELHDAEGGVIEFNDDWKDSQETEIEATKIPPDDEPAAAILKTRRPGNYTAILRGKDGSTGNGMLKFTRSTDFA